MLPLDPDGSARGLRTRFAELGVDVAVIISDTFGRAWREGQTDVAIGVAGLAPLTSYIGQVDPTVTSSGSRSCVSPTSWPAPPNW